MPRPVRSPVAAGSLRPRRHPETGEALRSIRRRGPLEGTLLGDVYVSHGPREEALDLAKAKGLWGRKTDEHEAVSTLDLSIRFSRKENALFAFERGDPR